MIVDALDDCNDYQVPRARNVTSATLAATATSDHTIQYSDNATAPWRA